ncbi:F0F1 ATP synthase subunit B [Tundrisphaera lichenicola]|uniref:F0F1 ATP synthase subunit B n=1 Tax=Tundrisphaera lichenicola TaxID=2029860 RepID=UPI003EBE4EDC
MLRQSILAFGLTALSIVLIVPLHTAMGQDKDHAPAQAAEVGHESAGEAHGEGSPPNIMEVQPSLAIYTLIVFVCLLLVLGRFAWKPLLKALHEREAHLEQVLLDSERARNEAEALATQNRRELANAADQVRALIDEARREAQVTADSIIRKAQAEAEAARERAEREIAGARDQALMEIWSKTADLAVSVAGRVLNKELNESDHRRLVEVALGELPVNGQQGASA